MAHRQLNQILSIHLFAMLMLLSLLPPAHVISLACNACGPECANACGTAMFRACCFNYNRKRSDYVEEIHRPATDISANLSEGEIFIPESKFSKMNPLFKHYFAEKLFRMLEKTPGIVRDKRKQYHLGHYML